MNELGNETSVFVLVLVAGNIRGLFVVSGSSPRLVTDVWKREKIAQINVGAEVKEIK